MSTSQAYDLGLKGCTTYRPNAVTGSVLSRSAPAPTRLPAGFQRLRLQRNPCARPTA